MAKLTRSRGVRRNGSWRKATSLPSRADLESVVDVEWKVVVNIKDMEVSQMPIVLISGN